MKLILTVLYALFGITTHRKLVCRGVGFLTAAVLCMGATEGCKTPAVKPDADATKNGAKNPVPENIESVKTNAAAAIAASEKKAAAKEQVAANAAASVEASQRVNTNQPPGPLTTFVDRELGVALKLLPPPDAATALEVEKRRSAVLEGRVVDADKLYAKAFTEAEAAKAEAARLKTEAEAAKGKHDAAVAALVAADKKYEAQLKANEAANQAKLDSAEARVKKAQDDLKNAEMKEQVKWLRVAGIACLLAAIGIGVMTNGIQIAKTAGFAAGSVLCFGLAQMVSHHLFMPIFIGSLVLIVAGASYWFWIERRDSMRRVGYEKTVKELEKVDLSAIPVKDDEGKDSNLAFQLSRKLGDPEKAEVRRIKLTHAVSLARATGRP